MTSALGFPTLRLELELVKGYWDIWKLERLRGLIFKIRSIDLHVDLELNKQFHLT